MILCDPDEACPHGLDSAQDNGMVVHDQSNNPALTSEWEALLIQYADIFEQPGKSMSRLVDHGIDLIDPYTVLPKLRLYQIWEDVLKSFKDTIDDYLAHGWIRPSSSSYGAPVIVICKKTGELRIVIDYQLFNKQTRLDSYPTLHIDNLLDCLARANYFSKIDLMFGQHQIKMADGHEQKTVVLTRYRTYEQFVLPLGLTIAPATFQRLMNGIFHDFMDKTLLVYIDDLFVYSNTDVQYLEDVKQVLQQLRDNKLKAKKQVILLSSRLSIFGILFRMG